MALAQVNPTVGDLSGNVSLVSKEIRRALAAGAEVVVFPELVISGYPPEDLLLKDHFLVACMDALTEAARSCRDVVALVGFPLLEEGKVYNAVGILAQGRIAGFYRKICLPNYSVFDEKRYFEPGNRLVVVDIEGQRLGVNVCEDIWIDRGPVPATVTYGCADAVVNLSMSPYHRGKGRERETLLSRRAAETGVALVYVNGVGGQDELVFDGQSVVFDGGGRLLARAPQFQERLLVVDVPLGDGPAARSLGEKASWPVESIRIRAPRGPARSATETAATPRTEAVGAADAGTAPAVDAGATPSVDAGATPASDTHSLVAPSLPDEAEVYEALCLGVRDYTVKNGFRHVVIGLSGGIDSALTACIAADALGPERVTCVSMPSRFSSSGTRSDAEETARRLGVRFHVIPLEAIFEAYLASLEPFFLGTSPGVTEQNIQARVRGNLLMALSNKFGWLVLTTGNKSEMAVGYATLYGDMAGGFAVLKDVPKTMVYRLAEFRTGRNGVCGPIPVSTIERVPSAELAPNQTDQDTLPPYELLDRIIEAYVVNDKSVDEIVATGIDRQEVERVVAMIDGNEYKRRQGAPGVRITPKAFGKDRRLPMTNRYRG